MAAPCLNPLFFSSKANKFILAIILGAITVSDAIEK